MVSSIQIIMAKKLRHFFNTFTLEKRFSHEKSFKLPKLMV